MKRVVLSMIMITVLVSLSVAQEKRYGIETIVLKKNMTMMRQTIPMIQYIADYGGKESAETFMNMQGQVFTVFTLMKDGYVYTINMTVKQGTKVNLVAMNDYKSVNYLNLTDDIRKKYNIVDKEEEYVLGKKCKKYEMSCTVQGQSMKGFIWVWQGLPLKTSMIVGGNTITDEVTEILEGQEIAAEKFELPEGVNFTEVKPQQ